MYLLYLTGIHLGFTLILLQIKSESEKKQVDHIKAVHAAQHAASNGEISSPSPPLPSSLNSSPNSSSGTAPVDQKRFAEAALKMIAEDMLPLRLEDFWLSQHLLFLESCRPFICVCHDCTLPRFLSFFPNSFVEGAGFRSFMNTISPEYSKLSQRALGLQLYDEVERSIKPQLIRDLKASLAKDGQSAIHVTLDLWVGHHHPNPAEDPILVMRIHFINESWQLRRPTVAFRHLARENLSAAVAKELEAVLLSYGIFPNNVGIILTNQAKDTLAKNSLFCNYKVMCPSNRGDPDADEIVAFISEHMSETESLFSELQIGTKTACAACMLQLVIKEALKNSRVVENLLMQVHNVVAFFRSNAYWSEVKERNGNISTDPFLVVLT